MAFLNQRHANSLLAPFTISRGDEFQGLLRVAAPLPDLIWDCELRLEGIGLRFGFGLGVLKTPLRRLPTETDGPAWWSARAAFDSAVATKREGGVFKGFQQADVALTAFGTLLHYIRTRMTSRQRIAVDRLRKGDDFVEAGEHLGITKQAVYSHSMAAGWQAYREGESAWRAALADFDYSAEWDL